MRWEQQIQYASISDIGFRRSNNEDRCLVHISSDRETWERRGHLFLVADGMGGHAVGELASKIATDTLPLTYYKIREAGVSTALKRAIETANASIHERAEHNRDFERMGTTCTAMVLAPEGAVIGHVGDCRVYRVRAGRIEQLTFDHSLQWELLKHGNLSAEEVFIHQPRNVITRSLGPEPVVAVDVEGPHAVSPGDVYLLCSDGLTGHVNDEEIGAILAELTPGEACRLLVHLANLRGGSDNITVVVVKVGEVPGGVESEPPPVSEPPRPGIELEWWHWASIWGVAALFVLSVVNALGGNLIAGAVLFALAGGGVAALLIYLWELRRQRQSFEHVNVKSDSGPYRTAAAEFSESLLTHVAAVEAELQRTATEEGWSINWEDHEAAYASAQSAVREKEYRRAFRHYARAVDVLMGGVQQYRKKMNREARWGKGSTPTTQQTTTNSS